MTSYRNKPNYRLDGNNPLGYMGVKPYTPPQMIVRTSAPTVKDYQGFALGTQWLHYKESSPTLSIQYVLSSVAQGVATWVPLNGTGGNGGFNDINIIYITNTGAGVYTPTAGMVKCTVECVGGGAGGFGFSWVAGPGTDQAIPNYASGSGGGSYCKKLYTSNQIGISQSYTVGSGGDGGVAVPPGFGLAAEPGDNGADTTFGAGPTLITSGGGQAAIINISGIALGGDGGTATGGDINIDGQMGQAYLTGFATVAKIYPNYGSGGNSGLSFGMASPYIPTQTIIGDLVYLGSIPGNNYGSGASGIYFGIEGGPQTTTVNGAAGAQGIIIITEYISG